MFDTAIAVISPAVTVTAPATACTPVKNCDPEPIDVNDKVEETLDAVFVQVNMEFIINDRPLNVVAGVRYEEPETTSTALEATPSVIRWDMINGLIYPNGGEVAAARSGSNDIVLPQLAMAYELSDDQVLRFSYGKSMGRPSLQDLRSSFQFGNRDYLIPQFYVQLFFF